MSLDVVFVATVLAAFGAREWARAVLADEERYVRAVRHLPSSALVRRVGGAAVRHRSGRRWAGMVATTLMGTDVFAAGWVRAHRLAHRTRPRAGRHATRTTVAMLALGAAGSAIAAGQAAWKTFDSA
ncbi:MAG: hypothetical protein U0Q22_12070 [Acidimicrobiales bacterium]